jgi:chromosome segregation ATPase
VDADLKAMLEAMEQRLAREMRSLAHEIRAVDARIDAQGRELRQAITDLAARVDAGFAARKQDEDLALREIRTLKGRVTNLERRVKRLESAR